MGEKYISLRNLKFMLYELFDVESLTGFSYFADHSRETFDMALEVAMKMSRDLIFPAFSEMDKEPPEYKDGEVKVHPVAGELMKRFGEGGWIGAHETYERGGQQMPGTIMAAFRTIFAAANYSAAVYPFLTAGAAHLITSFGTQELVDTYVGPMYAGKWQGTMALTEPQAGSSLTDITTTAHPTDEGHYKLKGQKIFISCADYDCIENVVNLLLARIEGAPLGTKGISLFVVPKKRPENGSLVNNDIVCTGIYHKLGYRGAPITQLAIGEEDECRGWLVGEPNKGLKCMFQMMNEARIDVGMSAAAIASAAYYAALDYCKERAQGRKITEKDPAKPQMNIINHADVKRMLLFQKAVVEGSLCLNLQCAKYNDLAHMVEGDDKERYGLLLDILTPVAKTYPSEMGIHAVSQGLQCLGGYGYCDEFPLEQHYRDVRIHPIHEGTTGIQGMDLLGRKVVMKEGKAFLLYLDEVGKAVTEAKEIEELDSYAASLEDALHKLKQVTTHLTGFALKGEIELFLANAAVYLEMFGIITMAWQWLVQAIRAQKALLESPSEGDENFYQGKLQTFRYFFEYELPKIEGLGRTLQSADDLTMNMKEAWFED